MKLVLSVLLCVTLCHTALALECYTCSVGEQDTDKTCVDAPEKVQKTNCNKKYCTIIRQEYKDPKDKVASMYRGCEDQPQHMDEVVEDGSYRFYYRSCQQDLCNGGSGKTDDGNPQQSLGDKSNLLVPGIGGSDAFYLSIFATIAAVIAHLFI